MEATSAGAMNMSLRTRTLGYHAVALFEAAKGGVVLIAGLGLLSLVHRDLQSGAELLVERLHLNPAQHYPQIFLHAMDSLTDARLWLLAAGAAAYAAVRFVEAYGLWRQMRWAKWVSVLSGSVYLPVELYELTLRGESLLKLGSLVVNAAIVAYVSRDLWLAKRGAG